MGIRDHARLIHQIVGTRDVRKAFRAIEDSVTKMGKSPLEWLAALPSLEQSVASLIESVRASNQSSDDLQFWIAELNLRLCELEKLTVRFAPWASTKLWRQAASTRRRRQLR